MEPTIYKPSIYKGAGIYKAGAEGGGGGGGNPPPVGWREVTAIRYNGTKENPFNIMYFNSINTEDVLFEMLVNYGIVNGNYKLYGIYCGNTFLRCNVPYDGAFDISVQNNSGGSHTERLSKNLPINLGLVKSTILNDVFTFGENSITYGDGKTNISFVYPFNASPSPVSGQELVYHRAKKGDNYIYNFVPIAKDDNSEVAFYDKVSGTICDMKDVIGKYEIL